MSSFNQSLASHQSFSHYPVQEDIIHPWEWTQQQLLHMSTHHLRQPHAHTWDPCGTIPISPLYLPHSVQQGQWHMANCRQLHPTCLVAKLPAWLRYSEWATYIKMPIHSHFTLGIGVWPSLTSFSIVGSCTLQCSALWLRDMELVKSGQIGSTGYTNETFEKDWRRKQIG